MHVADMYEKAREKLVSAEEHSDVQTDVEEETTRRSVSSTGVPSHLLSALFSILLQLDELSFEFIIGLQGLIILRNNR